MPSKNKKNQSEKTFYIFYFNAISGTYKKDVPHVLEDKFTDIFQGSGFSFDGDFECSFECTNKEKQEVKKFISNTWPKLKFTIEECSDVDC